MWRGKFSMEYRAGSAVTSQLCFGVDNNRTVFGSQEDAQIGSCGDGKRVHVVSNRALFLAKGLLLPFQGFFVGSVWKIAQRDGPFVFRDRIVPELFEVQNPRDKHVAPLYQPTFRCSGSMFDSLVIQLHG